MRLRLSLSSSQGERGDTGLPLFLSERHSIRHSTAKTLSHWPRHFCAKNSFESYKVALRYLRPIPLFPIPPHCGERQPSQLDSRQSSSTGYAPCRNHVIIPVSQLLTSPMTNFVSTCGFLQLNFAKRKKGARIVPQFTMPSQKDKDHGLSVNLSTRNPYKGQPLRRRTRLDNDSPLKHKHVKGAGTMLCWTCAQSERFCLSAGRRLNVDRTWVHCVRLTNRLTRYDTRLLQPLGYQTGNECCD